MTSQIFPGKRGLVLLLVSICLNLFLLGGISSYVLFGLHPPESVFQPPRGANHVPPPVRALNMVLNNAYPDLSDNGRKVAREAQDNLQQALVGLRPSFGEHRQELRRLMTRDRVDEAELDALLSDMMAKRNQLDPYLIDSVKHIAGNMDVHDRIILVNAIETLFRKGRKGPPPMAGPGS